MVKYNNHKTLKNMKTMKTTKMALALLGLALGLTFASCKKGDTGATGAKGADGKDGNANVISTNTVTLGTTWTYDASIDVYTKSITSSAITAAVKDKGVVMVYFQSINGWQALPYGGISEFDDFLSFEIVTGGINLEYKTLSTTANTVDPSTPLNGTVIRLVIIPSSMKKADVNYSNYDEVEAKYNL